MAFDGYLQQASFNNCVTVFLRWPDFKAIVNSKNLGMQYTQDNVLYNIFAIDGALVYNTQLVYNDANFPFALLWSDYPQAQNDIDVIDFQNNFQSNANKRISRTDLFGNPIHTTIQEAAAFGLLPNVVSSRMAGYVATSSIAAIKIRATTYTAQGNNAQRSLSSSNANDNAAGTGARTVTINYLNTSMVLKQDTITLNGTTAVNTNATDIAFIENMFVATAGTNLSNLGTISIFTGLGGTGSVWGSIAINDSQTFWAHHYVPAGVTCYLLNVSAGATAVTGRSFLIHTGSPIVANLPQIGIGGFYGHGAGGPSDEHEFNVPLAVPGPDLIIMEDITNASTASVSFGVVEYLQF
jgi:hypothetical protein